MGQAFRKLFDAFFGNSEMRVVMLGLDAAGKTTILYKLHIGEVLSTVPTIGFNVEKVQYKNVLFTVWDVGGQEKLRPLWRHYFNNTDGLIYVVDSLDRERIGKAKAEFQAIINDPFMLNSVILVFANKQDMKGAMTPMEVCEGLGLYDLKNRMWHIQDDTRKERKDSGEKHLIATHPVFALSFGVDSAEEKTLLGTCDNPLPPSLLSQLTLWFMEVSVLVDCYGVTTINGVSSF
ncbi:ADP-ribosylation factor [Hordeum vulgare]|nr:ADP-ribosylation factor [Hordeum vulgare]